MIVILMAGCADGINPIECGTNLMCTDQFEIHIYEAVDGENNPITLDSFYSQNLDNGNIYDFSEHVDIVDGNTYVVITDAEMDEVKRNGTTIRFFGEKDGEVIIQEDFLVGHDCCHIVVLEGPGVN